MNTEIVKSENVALIVNNAPQSLQENQTSRDRCLEYGGKILSTIQFTGMTDELDRSAADFIERAKKTVKKMNEKRSPVTKLFDEIRTVFTTLESEVDPTNPSTIPGQLQKLRNEYAAKKRVEAEARRLEEERRQRIENARNTYRLAVVEDVTLSFNRHLNGKFNELTELNRTVTLENYDARFLEIKSFPVTLSEDWITFLKCNALRPADLDTQSATAILRSVMTELLPKFREQYAFEMEENRNSMIDMLPSKKHELEAIAKAGAEEAARRQEEMKLREDEEARKREEERIRKEEEEKNKLKVQKQQNEMAGLFGQAAVASPAYQPKAKVSKKITVTDARGFLDILNLWWTTVGCSLSIDELSKKFKSQITLCEKLANDKSDPHFLQSPYITYEDEVKAN